MSERKKMNRFFGGKHEHEKIEEMEPCKKDQWDIYLLESTMYQMLMREPELVELAPTFRAKVPRCNPFHPDSIKNNEYLFD